MSIKLGCAGGTLPSIRTILVLILFAVLWDHSSIVRYPASHEREVLVRAVGRCRLVEGRFTGGFEYASYGTPIAHSAKVPLAKLARRGKFRSAQNSSSRLLAEMALLGVYGSNLRIQNLNRSIDLLQRATEDSPNDPELLSDLSAILLARGRLNSDPYDFVLAAAASSRALAKHDALEEAQFNLALALESLYLENEACRAWDRYLKIDNDSDWAYEARVRCRRSKPSPSAWEQARVQIDLAAMVDDQKVQEVVTEVVRNFPRSVRLYAEKQLLGAWASAAIDNHRSDADRYLRLVQAIGSALERQSGDHMVSGSVSEIRAALEEPSGVKLAALVRGYYNYAEGLRFSDQDDDQQALNRFEEASAYLAATKSPLLYRAELKAATCLFYLGEPEKSLDRLVALAAILDAKTYPTLTAEVLWIQGLSYSKLANFAAAFRVYKDAAVLFAAVGEQESIAFLHFLLGENLRYQGQPKKALQHLFESLKTIRTMGESRWYYNSLFDSAEIALRQDLPEAALCFQNEMIESSLRRKDPIAVTESLLRRARTFHRLDEPESALKDLRDARLWSVRVSSPVRRDVLGADIAMIAAEIHRARGEFDAATKLINSAIQEARGHGRMFRLPDLYEMQGFTFLEHGNEYQAELYFRKAIDELTSQRGHLTDRDLRISHFERSQRIFQELIHLALERGDLQDAFRLGEEARSRALLDALASVGSSGGGRGASILSESEIRRGLPSDAVLIEYAALQDSLVLFVLSRDSFEVFETNIDKDVLRSKVEKFVNSVRVSDEVMYRLLGAELYTVLISPALIRAGDSKSLIVAPDQFLSLIPYAALVNPASGRYLIEERGVMNTPSATSYVRLLSREVALRHHSVDSLLVVSDPEFDRKHFPDLVRLGGANREGRSLAALEGADSLMGSSATPSEFSKAAPSYDIVHIAAHARPNYDLPLHAALILAPELGSPAAGSGLLLASHIYRLRFPSTRLVVLAACEAAQGPILSGEGVDSLERSFLATGVPSVVASLWRVEDSSAADFFVAFHGELRRGSSIPDALRRAQMSFLEDADRSRRSPQAWAGFRILGGASFQVDEPN